MPRGRGGGAQAAAWRSCHDRARLEGRGDWLGTLLPRLLTTPNDSQRVPETTNTRCCWLPITSTGLLPNQTPEPTPESKTSVHSVKLAAWLNSVLDSNHHSAQLLFDEDLLELGPAELAEYAREPQRRALGNECWFSLFETEVRPKDCVIVTGEGARSTLHRDPFEVGKGDHDNTHRPTHARHRSHSG